MVGLRTLRSILNNMLSPEIKESCLNESKDYFLVKHPDRVKLLGEVFTPTELVLEILDQLPQEVWEDGNISRSNLWKWTILSSSSYH
jgi:hypothetical protein